MVHSEELVPAPIGVPAAFGPGTDVDTDGPYKLLVNAVGDCGIFLLDLDGRIATWSAGAERMTGFSAAEVVGRSCTCLYPPEDVLAGKPMALLSIAVQRGRIEDEGWLVRKDGSRFCAEVIITAVRDRSGALRGLAQIARDSTKRLQLEDDLGDAQDRLRALTAHITRTSEREKMALAREIHDVLGQELTGLKLDSAWLVRRIRRTSDASSDAPDASRADAWRADAWREPLLERLDAMGAQLDTCMQIVRRIATGLRPGVLDDLGLAAAIEWQSREFELRAGIKIELSLPDETLSMDRERATAIFRIFQELVTNTIRHAGATKVTVVLGREENVIMLVYVDDGRGLTELEQSRPNALGILGMRERAAQFGGSVTLHGVAGRGTRATVRVPV